MTFRCFLGAIPDDALRDVEGGQLDLAGRGPAILVPLTNRGLDYQTVVR